MKQLNFRAKYFLFTGADDLAKIGRYNLRLLASAHGVYQTEAQQHAFMALSCEEQAKLVSQHLQRDRTLANADEAVGELLGIIAKLSADRQALIDERLDISGPLTRTSSAQAALDWLRNKCKELEGASEYSERMRGEAAYRAVSMLSDELRKNDPVVASPEEDDDAEAEG